MLSCAAHLPPPAAEPDLPPFVVQVFINNIPDICTNELMRAIIERCGSLNSWKRIIGAFGKLQSFGVAEFATPVAALRAISIFNKLAIGDNELLAKVGEKTQPQLNAFVSSYMPPESAVARSEASVCNTIRTEVELIIKQTLGDVLVRIARGEVIDPEAQQQSAPAVVSGEAMQLILKELRGTRSSGAPGTAPGGPPPALGGAQQSGQALGGPASTENGTESSIVGAPALAVGQSSGNSPALPRGTLTGANAVMAPSGGGGGGAEGTGSGPSAQAVSALLDAQAARRRQYLADMDRKFREVRVFPCVNAHCTHYCR